MKYRNTLKNGFMYFIGCIIYSAAVNVLISPNGISPGGFTGLSTLIHYVFNFNTGLILLIINIPVIIIGYLRLGGLFIAKTFFVTLILSFTIDITETLLPEMITDKLLASLFGGIFMGIGISIVLYYGASTGGVDIIAKLINENHPHITVGRVILFSDLIIISLAAIVYKNPESAMYSVISLYASSKITDVILYGFDKGKTAFIISNSHGEICKGISENLHRGVTKIKAIGGYTDEEKTMLICSVRPQEIAGLYKIIKASDKDAFIILTDATEILGNGFKK